MPRVCELPTHLQVEDRLIAGLTARQCLRLVIGASLGYGVWDQVRWVPEEIRLALALVLAVIGVLFALIRPFGRPLDQWLMAGLLFVLLPHRLAWRPGAALPRHPSREQSGWAELELRPEWLGAVMQLDMEESEPRTPFNPAVHMEAEEAMTHRLPNGIRSSEESTLVTNALRRDTATGVHW